MVFVPFNYIDSLRSGCTTPEPCGFTTAACVYFSGVYTHLGASSATTVISGITGIAGCNVFNATKTIPDHGNFAASSTCTPITYADPFLSNSPNLQVTSTAIVVRLNYGIGTTADFGFLDACSVIHAIDALVAGSTVEFPYISGNPGGCDYSTTTVLVTISP